MRHQLQAKNHVQTRGRAKRTAGTAQNNGGISPTPFSHKHNGRAYSLSRIARQGISGCHHGSDPTLVPTLNGSRPLLPMLLQAGIFPDGKPGTPPRISRSTLPSTSLDYSYSFGS